MFKAFLSALLILLLNACGGGGGTDSSGEVSIQPLNNGIIVDSQISGLRYISVSQDKTQIKKGITNEKGEYQYFENGTTEFYVGNLKIVTAAPKKYLSVTNVVSSEVEAQNVARFLQTLDEDQNPENGIKISTDVDENAKRDIVANLTFGSDFDIEFENIKNELFKHSANLPATVTVDQALGHASKAARFSSLSEFSLYKAVANENNYRSASGYYNADVLENDQRKRIYLWIWDNLLLKEMNIEDELQFTKPSYDLNNVEETTKEVQKYIDYTQSVVSISALGKNTYDNMLKAGSRTMGYNLAKLTSLSIEGCDAVVSLYDTQEQIEEEYTDSDLCTNIMRVVNPVNESSTVFAATNPILSGFLPELLPKLLHAQKMNWLHLNTKSLRTISKMKANSPDIKAIALSILEVANNFYGASWASDINEEIITRMVAKEWLSAWYRSGMDREYMNTLINNNATPLVDRRAQIEALALKLGSTGALCDTLDFFLPFYKCTGVETINYDYDKVEEIIMQKLPKSNALYRNVVELIGPQSNQEGEVGVLELNWVEDTALYDTRLVEADLDDEIVGKLTIVEQNGTVAHSVPSDTIVRFTVCEGNTFWFSENYKGKIQSDGVFSIDLDSYPKDLNTLSCNLNDSKYAVQFFRDTNGDGTLWIPDGDIFIGGFTSDNLDDFNVTAYHIKAENRSVASSSMDLNGKYISYLIDTTSGFASDELYTAPIVDSKITMDYYVTKDKDITHEIDMANNIVYIHENANSVYDDILTSNYLAIASRNYLDNIKVSKPTIKNVLTIIEKFDLVVDENLVSRSGTGELDLNSSNSVVNGSGTKEVLISNDAMDTLDTADINDIFSRNWEHIHSNDNYNCISNRCTTQRSGKNYRLIIKDNAADTWAISGLFDLE